MHVATFQGHVVVPVSFASFEDVFGERATLVRAEMCDHHNGHFNWFLASELVIVNKRTDPEKMSEVTGWGKCCRELMIAEIFKGRNA